MTDKEMMRRALEVALRLSLVAGLVLWCFVIFRPFVIPVMWGVIIAVALHPTFLKLAGLLGDRKKTAGVVFVLVALAMLVIPVFALSSSFVEGMGVLTHQLQQGDLAVPPPPAQIKDWPVVGERLYASWQQASESLATVLVSFRPQLEKLLEKLLAMLAGTAGGLIVSAIAIVIAGLAMVNAGGGSALARSIGRRLGGDPGVETVDLAAATIRSVAKGVVGVALVQATLSAIGLVVAGIPGAAVWATLVLILGVAQLPPLFVLLPAVVYFGFTADNTVGTIVFAIYALLVSSSDAVLKPMFLGRGMKIPMPVILIGAIGGMLSFGIIGLFVGAVILAIGYTLFKNWLEAEPVSEENPA